MGKVILICGKLCSGKTTYCAALQQKTGALPLSADALMLALFPEPLGDAYDAYARRARDYLLSLAAQLCATGQDVVLDWGFWTRADRRATREFFARRGIPCELHYLDVPDEIWRQRVKKRNQTVAAGNADAYFVDDGLMAKFNGRFEEPAEEEIDLRVQG